MGTCFQEDILGDILSRLPVKSVVRFKCVSKSWNGLISESYFQRKHFNYHAKNQRISDKMVIRQSGGEDNTYYFYSSSLSPDRIIKDVQKLDCPTNYEPGFCKIACCCDGLFLMEFHNRSLEDRIFFIWNPSTRQSRLLPQQDRYSSNSIYGLGYDSTSDDYKVLKVEDGKNDAVVGNEILSLKSGSWRKIHGSSDGRYGNRWSENGRDCLAFVHGAFHWLQFIARIGSWFLLISFDISNETYGEVPLPEQIWRYDMMDKHVTVLGGMLSINCVYRYENPFVDVWVMKDYGVKESWTKVCSMNMGVTDVCRVIPVIPQYIFENGEVLLRCRNSIDSFVTSRGSIGLSNLMRPLVNDDIDKNIIHRAEYVYTESLISP